MQLSRIEELHSEYEDKKNENNKLRQQIFDEKKAAQQQRNQFHNLVKENGDLKRRQDKLKYIFKWVGYVVYRHFQQYFSYIVAVSFIG